MVVKQYSKQFFQKILQKIKGEKHRNQPKQMKFIKFKLQPKKGLKNISRQIKRLQTPELSRSPKGSYILFFLSYKFGCQNYQMQFLDLIMDRLLKEFVNMKQNQNQGSPRIFRDVPQNQPKDRQRSIKEGFGQMYHSIVKKLLLYTLNKQVYCFYGGKMNLINCPRLIRDFLDGKKKSQSYIRFFFKIDKDLQSAKITMKKYVKSKRIKDYFEKYPQRLEQQKKKIIQIFSDFLSVLPYAFWYFIFGRKIIQKAPYLKQIDTKFNQLYQLSNFNQYISKLSFLDMATICNRLLPKIQERENQIFSNLTTQEIEDYDGIRKQAKNYQTGKRNNKVKLFQINQQQKIQQFDFQDQMKIMKKFMKFTYELLSLNENGHRTNNGLSFENIGMQRQDQIEIQSEEQQMLQSPLRSQADQYEPQYMLHQQQLSVPPIGQVNNPNFPSHPLRNNQIQASYNFQSIFINQSEMLSQQKLFTVFDELILMSIENKQHNQNKQQVISPNNSIEQEEEPWTFQKQIQDIRWKFTKKYSDDYHFMLEDE